MSIERVMQMHEKNEEIVGGETIIYKGEEHTVPPMSEEELEQMKKEGEEIAEIEIVADGKAIKLIDMDDGRKLYKRLQALEVEGNTQAFWYLWREVQIEKEFKKLPEAKAKQIKKILGRK